MKEGDSTEKLVESLVEELNCETVFTIPVFGGIAVDEGVVVTWIIMAVLTILSIVFVRNLSVEKPGKVQLMLESVIGWAQDFLKSRYPDYTIELTKTVDADLLGGYVIRAHHKEYDRSFEGRFCQLERKLTGR